MFPNQTSLVRNKQKIQNKPTYLLLSSVETKPSRQLSSKDSKITSPQQWNGLIQSPLISRTSDFFLWSKSRLDIYIYIQDNSQLEGTDEVELVQPSWLTVRGKEESLVRVHNPVFRVVWPFQRQILLGQRQQFRRNCFDSLSKRTPVREMEKGCRGEQERERDRGQIDNRYVHSETKLGGRALDGEKNRILEEISRVRYFALINNLMQMNASVVPGDLHYMIIYTCL